MDNIFNPSDNILNYICNLQDNYYISNLYKNTITHNVKEELKEESFEIIENSKTCDIMIDFNHKEQFPDQMIIRIVSYKDNKFITYVLNNNKNIYSILWNIANDLSNSGKYAILNVMNPKALIKLEIYEEEIFIKENKLYSILLDGVKPLS